MASTTPAFADNRVKIKLQFVRRPSWDSQNKCWHPDGKVTRHTESFELWLGAGDLLKDLPEKFRAELIRQISKNPEYWSMLGNSTQQVGFTSDLQWPGSNGCWVSLDHYGLNIATLDDLLQLPDERQNGLVGARITFSSSKTFPDSINIKKAEDNVERFIKPDTYKTLRIGHMIDGYKSPKNGGVESKAVCLAYWHANDPADIKLTRMHAFHFDNKYCIGSLNPMRPDPLLRSNGNIFRHAVTPLLDALKAEKDHAAENLTRSQRRQSKLEEDDDSGHVSGEMIFDHVAKMQKQNNVLPNIDEGVPLMPPYTFNTFKAFGGELTPPDNVDFNTHLDGKQIHVMVRCVNHIPKLETLGGVYFPEDIHLFLEPSPIPGIEAQGIRDQVCERLKKSKEKYTRGRASYVLFNKDRDSRWKMELWILPQQDIQKDGMEGQKEFKMYRFSTDGVEEQWNLAAFMRRSMVEKGDLRLYMEAHIIPADGKNWVVTGSICNV